MLMTKISSILWGLRQRVIRYSIFLVTFVTAEVVHILLAQSTFHIRLGIPSPENERPTAFIITAMSVIRAISIVENSKKFEY